jgi:hypothetical protein
VTDRTRSHLLKAQQLKAGIRADTLASVQITQAQDAAEHAFRAILFGMSVNRMSDHRLDLVARQHQAQLADIWPRLEPLLEDYAWLWELRNVARYSHIDAPPVAHPHITADDLDRAKRLARSLIVIAERLI